MKKIFCLFGLLLLLTGCSSINNLSYDDIVDNILSSDGKKANEALIGYKIYLPVGMTLINDNSSNNTLYSNGDKYYLYADVISYYNKLTNDYKINNEKDAYYYKELNYNDKTGYILITSKNNAYFIEMMYNYAKVEVITTDVKDSMVKALTVLNSLSYNDFVVDSLVGSNILSYNEEEYKLEGPNGDSSTDNFLKYEEEYSYTDDAYGVLPDNDVIDINTNTNNSN